MASEEASLRALESLMTEFFHDCTTNERKREIEELLNNFAQQIGAWRFCLYFLSSTRNDYVMMYSLTVFENLINKMWLGVPSQDKMEIRGCLPKLLLAHHKTLPYFIRNKLCKVIVDIGRQDWPMFYHDFFTNILQLIQSPVTTPLGLIMLKTTSEELACPREDLSVARKEELRKLLLDQVQTVLGLLTGILETVWDKHSVTAATPPPSPTSGESGDLLSNLLQSPSSAKLLNQPIPILDVESEYICSLALECLAHLFSWIPLSASITPSLLTTIFHFARFGCDIRARKMASVNGSSQNCVLGQERGRLGVLAMSCINELMSKNCVPMEFEEYLLRMFQQTFYLLQKITKDNNAHTVKSRLEELDESYVEKFTDFLRLFVSVHLRRIESYSQFPVVEFLTLLFKYTFHQPTHEGYFSCLDIWTLFLDYLTSKIKSRLGDKEAVLNRYEDALVLLLTEVLNRIQFRYNQAQLEELDDETLDDDQQTEWQRYLRQSLEVVAKVMELLPTHAFSTLFPVLQDNLEVYLGLQQFIVTSGSGHRLNITAENDCRRLHCSLRDLSSLLQAAGRLAEYFIGDVFAARFNDALTVVERLVKVTLYGSQIKLYNIETAVPSVLKPDLIDVHAQSLAALQAYSHWLAQYCSEAHRQNTQQFVTLISTTMDAITPLISTKVQDKLLLSACHLLVSLATTVRPVFLISIPAVQKVFNRITDASAQRLVDKAQVLVCRALSNILLLPWPNLPENEQQWPVRSINHASLISALSRDYRDLKPSAITLQRKVPLDDTKVIIHQTLSVLEDIVENISGESTKSRQICYQSLQESVQVSLALFPAFIHQSDVTDEMLSFFLTLFRGLRVQMGVPFTEQIIQTFLNMFTREQLAESILHEGSTGCRVVEKFLKILQVVVQEPGQVFKPFLPSIIALCMEQVYPIIAEAFGQSFLQPDIHLFKQNLFYLETLNAKQKLYHKKIFRTTMLFQFVNVLLQVLVHKSHDLLQEEIGIAIYNMASVDFDGFFAAFLPEFLTGCDGVDANQKNVLGRNFKMDRDLPSFTQNVHRLVNDLQMSVFCPAFLAQDHEGRERPKDGSLRGSELSPGDARSRRLGEWRAPAPALLLPAPQLLHWRSAKTSRRAHVPPSDQARRGGSCGSGSPRGCQPLHPSRTCRRRFPPARTWGQGRLRPTHTPARNTTLDAPCSCSRALAGSPSLRAESKLLGPGVRAPLSPRHPGHFPCWKPSGQPQFPDL
uniref:Exportin-6 n=1 Tax=Oryctolagus cuniculus TaxID=9986 RepID=A0A5F9CS31_RABIT